MDIPTHDYNTLVSAPVSITVLLTSWHLADKAGVEARAHGSGGWEVRTTAKSVGNDWRRI